MNTFVRKSKFALSLIYFIAISTSVSSAQTMYYHTADGKQISYNLLTVSNMTFTDENFIVRNNTGSTDAYPLANFWKLNFKFETALNPDLIFNTKIFSVYPNPVQEVLTLTSFGEVHAGASIKILNLEGKVLVEQLITNSGDIQINTSQFPAGIYLCQFNNGTKITSQKIIKQ
jgi:hypothetical protein